MGDKNSNFRKSVDFKLTGVFKGRLARVRGQNWEIENGGSKLADKILNFSQIGRY